jgi:hypothetical protein
MGNSLDIYRNHWDQGYSGSGTVKARAKAFLYVHAYHPALCSHIHMSTRTSAASFGAIYSDKARPECQHLEGGCFSGFGSEGRQLEKVGMKGKLGGLTHNHGGTSPGLLHEVAPLPGPDAGHVSREVGSLEVLLHIDACSRFIKPWPPK